MVWHQLSDFGSIHAAEESQGILESCLCAGDIEVATTSFCFAENSATCALLGPARDLFQMVRISLVTTR